MAKGGFRGMPGGMNQAAMMRQVQKMQQEAMRMQEEMENKTYTAAAGGGVVTAAVNGKLVNADGAQVRYSQMGKNGLFVGTMSLIMEPIRK